MSDGLICSISFLRKGAVNAGWSHYWNKGYVILISLESLVKGPAIIAPTLPLLSCGGQVAIMSRYYCYWERVAKLNGNDIRQMDGQIATLSHMMVTEPVDGNILMWHIVDIMCAIEDEYYTLVIIC